MVTDRGDLIGLGDRIATRANDPALGVANRQTWTVVGIGDDGSLIVHSPEVRRDRELPSSYVRELVELAYATTVHGAQGETVDHAHVAISETTGAAAAYVGMTRGRHTNIAHLVAESLEDARAPVDRGVQPRPRRPRTSPRTRTGDRRHRPIREPTSTAATVANPATAMRRTDPRPRSQPVTVSHDGDWLAVAIEGPARLPSTH